MKTHKGSQALVSDSKEPSSVSANELSFAAGYADGERDKKKEGR